ncbi:anti-sigma factor family protein [Rhabdothermincola salaria]|uniref:anti-sigma factor family protein n=1 Tax=Rhabdothermincola salaria TaxID=2903142 RepID=UPI001E58D173|nr:zf-HC2 domain-containing protein [Rhabdothermincola salaria]MCD9624249.1 zf-HC2 domain-containing protein [Rhabdothermincola salaria]
MKLLRRLMGRRSELSCAEVAAVLQSYLDDELDAQTAEKVHEHLEECRRCGMEAATYEELKAALRRGPDGLTDEPVRRLREFGERLAHGEVDPEQLGR